MSESTTEVSGGGTNRNSGPITRCGLCGRDPAAGTAGAWNEGVETRLCHGDDDPTPTCYGRWVHGERPVLPVDLFVLSERGFVQGRPIPSEYGGAAKVYEPTLVCPKCPGQPTPSPGES